MRAIAPCWRMRAIAPSMPPHARPPPEGPPEAHALVLCRNQARYKHAPMLERPPQCYQRLELAEGASPRKLTCHCTGKAGCVNSTRLYICRVAFSCCGSVAALLALAKCNEHMAKANISRRHAYTKRSCARATGISCFSCPTATRSFLRFSAPLRPFSPTCPLPPGYFYARDFAHAGELVR
jgi:hypothetical protein